MASGVSNFRKNEIIWNFQFSDVPNNGGGGDVATTLASGQTPGPSRPGTKYPVRGQSLTSMKLISNMSSITENVGVFMVRCIMKYCAIRNHKNNDRKDPANLLHVFRFRRPLMIRALACLRASISSSLAVWRISKFFITLGSLTLSTI